MVNSSKQIKVTFLDYGWVWILGDTVKPAQMPVCIRSLLEARAMLVRRESPRAVSHVWRQKTGIDQINCSEALLGDRCLNRIEGQEDQVGSHLGSRFLDY